MGINIYKQDSTFINTNTNLELSYNINYLAKVGLLYMSETSSNLLDITASDITSYKSNFYGGSYNYKIINNSVLFPTKLNFKVNALLGNRV